MMNESIGVVVSFQKGQVSPRMLLLGNRQVSIRQILYRWHDKLGSSCLHFFSVTDGINVYELVFDNQTLGWRLRGTEPLV